MLKGFRQFHHIGVIALLRIAKVRVNGQHDFAGRLVDQLQLAARVAKVSSTFEVQHKLCRRVTFRINNGKAVYTQRAVDRCKHAFSRLFSWWFFSWRFFDWWLLDRRFVHRWLFRRRLAVTVPNGKAPTVTTNFARGYPLARGELDTGKLSSDHQLIIAVCKIGGDCNFEIALSLLGITNVRVGSENNLASVGIANFHAPLV